MQLDADAQYDLPLSPQLQLWHLHPASSHLAWPLAGDACSLSDPQAPSVMQLRSKGGTCSLSRQPGWQERRRDSDERPTSDRDVTRHDLLAACNSTPAAGEPDTWRMQAPSSMAEVNRRASKPIFGAIGDLLSSVLSVPAAHHKQHWPSAEKQGPGLIWPVQPAANAEQWARMRARMESKAGVNATLLECSWLVRPLRAAGQPHKAEVIT